MTKLIAEFCQNHNGNFDLLARMIEAAAKSGATHGKMQTIKVDTLAFRPQFEEGLEIDGKMLSIKRPFKDEFERLKTLEVSDKDTERFIALCRENGIEPMTTCFSRAHVDTLSEIGFDTIKVASYDCASFPMLRELSSKFDEIIVSTGATYDQEILHAANILSDNNYAFLHCVTLYPTPIDQMHLARMEWLRRIAPVVGYSDHSLVARDGIMGTKAAMALGADVIERHFTIEGADDARDGPVSITPAHMQELSDFSSLSLQERKNAMDSDHPGWKVAIGQENRELSDAELLNRDYYRGRFASPRSGSYQGTKMIYNYEETPLQHD